MLHPRLSAAVRAVTQPTIRQVSVELGPPPAAVHAAVLAELTDDDLMAMWPTLRPMLADGRLCVAVDEMAQYMPGEAQR
jgi:hypothetical protein